MNEARKCTTLYSIKLELLDSKKSCTALLLYLLSQSSNIVTIKRNLPQGLPFPVSVPASPLTTGLVLSGATQTTNSSDCVL